MTGDTLRFGRFVAGEPSTVAFESLRARLYPVLPFEPLTPGTECLLAWRGDGENPVARATLALADNLHGAPGPTGLIGHYETLDRDAGVALLGEARVRLASRAGPRIARVLGPMNGNTWARYRLALASELSDRAFEPPVFLSEPQNPFDYPEHFEAAGFGITARYLSRIDLDPGREATDADSLARAVAARGVSVRTLDLSRYDEELNTLHALSLEAFADNLYYTPLPLAPFRAMYEKLRPLIDPELVLFAEDGSGVVAFQFAFLDPTSTQDGRARRAIVKTVATAPRARGMGLGHHMLDLLRRRAHERGAREVIHALMHVTNFSTRMSARHETLVFRRYALYQWTP